MLNGLLAWKCAIPHKHSDMVNSKAAKGSRFFWTGYLVDLDNHIRPSRALSVCGKGGCHPRPVTGPTRCAHPAPVCGSVFRWPGHSVCSGDGGPFLALIEADQPSAWRQAASDAQRAVTGESANFDGQLRADCGYQQGHEAALLPADLHPADVAERFRGRPQRFENRIVGVTATGADITIQPVV